MIEYEDRSGYYWRIAFLFGDSRLTRGDKEYLFDQALRLYDSRKKKIGFSGNGLEGELERCNHGVIGAIGGVTYQGNLEKKVRSKKIRMRVSFLVAELGDHSDCRSEVVN